jgi:hypothetical protein
MVDRIQLSVPTYMIVDGQWAIAQPGSVLDVPSAAAFSPSTAKVLTEPAGSLASHGKATPVRNVRTGF